MSKYEDSIKCKYCSHFEPGANRCLLYHDYDQSLDKVGGADSDIFRTSEKWVSVIKWLFAGLGIGFIVSFIWGAVNNTSSFPAGIMIVCTIVFGCIGFFKG